MLVMVLIENKTDQVVAKMTAIKAVGELAWDVAAIRCFVLSQAIAGVESFKYDILNDDFPIPLKDWTFRYFVGLNIDRGIDLKLLSCDFSKSVSAVISTPRVLSWYP